MGRSLAPRIIRIIFSVGVVAVAFAGEVVLTAYMLQTAMRAVIIVVAAIMASLRIVLSLQEMVCRYWTCLLFAPRDAASRDVVQ